MSLKNEKVKTTGFKPKSLSLIGKNQKNIKLLNNISNQLFDIKRLVKSID
jgi:hypothetical protein